MSVRSLLLSCAQWEAAGLAQDLSMSTEDAVGEKLGQGLGRWLGMGKGLATQYEGMNSEPQDPWKSWEWQ